MSDYSGLAVRLSKIARRLNNAAGEPGERMWVDEAADAITALQARVREMEEALVHAAGRPDGEEGFNAQIDWLANEPGHYKDTLASARAALAGTAPPAPVCDRGAVIEECAREVDQMEDHWTLDDPHENPHFTSKAIAASEIADRLRALKDRPA